MVWFAQSCPAVFLNGTRMTSGILEAKKAELLKQHGGHIPTEAQIMSSIISSELVKHCRRRTCGVKETHTLIHGLLDSMWELTDTTVLRLVNPASMTCVWEVQQKHLPCIQDPPGVQPYTKMGFGVTEGRQGPRCSEVWQRVLFSGKLSSPPVQFYSR